MKWIAFVAALLLVYPGAILLRGNPEYRMRAWTLLGLLPFFAGGIFDINLVSFEWYRGDSRGIEVTLVDLLVLAFYTILPKGRQPAPYRAERYAYLAAVLISLTQATEPLFSWFSVWKLLRMYLLVIVVSRACQDIRVARAILGGMALGVLSQFAMVLFQRYGLGYYQTPGFFAHQNSLGSAVNLVAPVWLVTLITRPRDRFAQILAVVCAATVVMTLSRGALAVFAGVSGLTWLAMAIKRPNQRLIVVSMMGLLFVIAILVRAGDTLIERFTGAPDASAIDRIVMRDASAAMLHDHPLGIGINQYSLVTVEQGYYELAAMANGLTLHGGNPIPPRLRAELLGGIVHNIYWLTAAELGIIGFACFVWLIASPVYLAIRHGWRARKGERECLLLGLGIGLFGLYVHGTLEWTMRQTSISYLFWISAGMIHALAHQARERPGAVGQEASPRRREPRQPRLAVSRSV